jgi:hypothetical protein
MGECKFFLRAAGQQHTKDAGQQTSWQEKGYSILQPAHFMTKLKKQSTIF